MRLHLQRLALGAVILAILLGVLWEVVQNDQLLNMILYVGSFCLFSYLIGYFLMKLRFGKYQEKVNAMIKSLFTAIKRKKVGTNDSRRAEYRKTREQQRRKNAGQ
jgi:Na+/H+-translocating membrane pyrophosphatase